MTSISTRRTGINTGDIKAGLAVRALTHVDMARITHWALGRGMQLIPNVSYSSGISLGSATQYDFSFRVRPRYQALERLWMLDIGMDKVGATTTVEVEAPTGTTIATYTPAFSSAESRRPQIFTETIGTQSSSEASLTLSLTPGASSYGVTLYGVSCYEMPRAALATDASDDGTSLNTFTAGQAMDEADFTNLADVLSDESKIGRRVLFNWAVPYQVGGSASTSFALNITSASYVDAFDLPFPVLARRVDPEATTGTITAKFLAWVDSNSADIRLNSSENGASSAVNITTTTPAWSSAVTLGVDCTAFFSGLGDGRQTYISASWDELDIQARQNTSGNLYIAGISIWED